MHIWTDTPLEEIWNQLRYFASSANVQNLLVGNIESGRSEVWSESEQLKHHSYEISSCIRQADEYFKASRTVGLATKPLLQFYGAQALSKAVILANDSSLSLQQLRYHGLSTRPSTANNAYQEALQSYNDDTSSWQFEAEYAITHNGVFPHLARITGDTVPPQGEVLRVIELLRIIPDIAKRYDRHYGEPSHCLYLYVKPKLDENGCFSIYFSSRIARENILKVFPEFSSGYEAVAEHSRPGFRSIDPISEDPEFGVIEKGSIAGRYFVRPHRTGIHKPLTVLYALMFILSNIVRYKPAFWVDVVEGRSSGASSIAEAITNVFARRFPNEVLEQIWHEPFTYGSPGYLT